MSDESAPINQEEMEVTSDSNMELDGNESPILPRRSFFGSIGTMISRVWRAFRIDTTLYDELKADSPAPSETHKVILIIGSIYALLGVLVNGLQIDYILFFFLLYIAFLYINAILAWFVGIKLKRKDGTFDQVRTALTYGIIPKIFLLLPSPWNLLGFWSLVTIFPALRKTLGISIILTIVIIAGGEILNELISPIIIPLIFDFLFTMVLSGRY